MRYPPTLCFWVAVGLLGDLNEATPSSWRRARTLESIEDVLVGSVLSRLLCSPVALRRRVGGWVESDLVGAAFGAGRKEGSKQPQWSKYSKWKSQSGTIVAANGLKRGRGYGMSLNGKVASNGYNRITMRSRKPEWRFKTDAVSIVMGWLACGTVAIASERARGRRGWWMGTQREVEDGYGMGWSRCRLDEAGMLPL